MVHFYKRHPEDGVDQQLLDAGWEFAGTALFKHPNIYNKFFTKKQAIEEYVSSESAEIIIKVKGPHANDVVGEFWAWFLDGGGAQMFCNEDLNPVDGQYTFYDTYDKENNEWIIRVENKE